MEPNPDPTAIFTFEDNTCVPYTDPSFFFPENPTLGQCVQNNTTVEFPEFNPGNDLGNILDPEDPLSDPVIWSFCNGDDDGQLKETPGLPLNSEIVGDSISSSGANEFFDFTDYSIPEDNSVQISLYNCVCCQRLRVITHTNGMSVKRLEIHGGLGEITHAVLEIYSFDSSLNNQENVTFDFQNESLEAVKQFLIQYFALCKQEGYRTLQDPLLSFYEALSVGLHDPDTLNDFLQPSSEYIGDCSNPQQQPLRQIEGGSNQEGDFMKIPLAMQRERTKNLTLKDLSNYFNLPIEDAARKLNICPTVMKKICRRNGMLRWPYRKIKSLERKISNNIQMMDSSQGEEKAQLVESIQKYQKELVDIYEAFTD